MSFFGILDYNYAGRYYLQASVRGDGSSRFGKNSVWGAFYSIGASWNAHNEAFMEDVDWVDLLKVRASYGVNGNINGLADWAADGNYSVGQTFFGNPAIRISYPANDDVKWERSKTFDIGGDFKFLNSRLNITADYFRRKTDHLITMFTLPPSTGLGDVYTNLGSLENKGVELEINAEVRFGLGQSIIRHVVEVLIAQSPGGQNDCNTDLLFVIITGGSVVVCAALFSVVA